MTVGDNDFQTRSEAALKKLYVSLGTVAETYDADVLFQGGVLTVEIQEGANPGKMVISPNTPAHQIWISAQLKSFKLDWNSHRDAFVLAVTDETLDELVGRLIGEQIGAGRIRLT
jgi:iron donor protein CyaY